MKLERGHLMVLPIVLVGCEQPAVDFLTPPEPPMVWPKPPDAPRIRFVGQLTGSENARVRKGLGDVWNELLYGPQPPSKLVSPNAVAVNANGNRVAVADVNGTCVHVFDLTRKSYKRLVSAGTPPQALACPTAACWVNDALWIADSKLPGIAVFDSSNQGRWIGREELKRPAGMAYCPSNQLCYVCDAGAHAVLAFDSAGKLMFQFGSRGAGPGQFNFPSHIACGSDDTLVVADSLNFRVQRFALDGSPLTTFGRKGDAAGDLALPKGVAVDPDGTIWVVDARFENVQAFTPEGQLLMAFGEEGQGPGEFWLPAGICVDSQRRMWVADTYNRRVQVFQLLQ